MVGKLSFAASLILIKLLGQKLQLQSAARSFAVVDRTFAHMQKTTSEHTDTHTTHPSLAFGNKRGLIDCCAFALLLSQKKNEN